jgi:anti-sigma regulatory factor (Ser/Thr protein kinase)
MDRQARRIMTITTGGRSTQQFDHPALFYRDDEDYVAATVTFIRSGLDADEPVLVAVPEANLELVRDALGGDAFDVELMDMTVAGRNPGRIIGEVLLPFAEKNRERRVRIVGEPIWLGRTATEYPACVQHEALINLAFAGRSATILCPYHLDSLHPRVIEDAKRTHPILCVDDRRSVSPSYTDPVSAAEAFNTELSPLPPAARTMIVHGLNLAAVREFATAHATALGLRPARVDDAVMAVNELAANTLTHGGGTGTLSAWSDRDRVMFQLADRGHIMNPLAGRVPATFDQIGGRGLLFINRLCDLVRVHTRPGDTTVRIYFNR